MTEAQLVDEVQRLRRKQDRLEDRVVELLKERQTLKRQRALKRLVSLKRLAAYTRAVKETRAELALTEAKLARYVKALNAKRKPTGIRGKAQRVLDHRNTRFPLPLSTGGTSRRDFVQLAAEGKVRVPATGAVIVATPGGYIDRALDAILWAADRGLVNVNAFVGGVHRAGSLHYQARAVDNGEDEQNMNQGVRRTGGNTFDEDPYHDHQWWGPGGP